MNKKLTEELYKKYPKIFSQHTLPMTETAMCWNFQCGDGWFFLIDKLCELLQWDIDHNKHSQIEATTVKEKYGSIRFYTNGQDDKQGGIIDFAELLSNFICEECGSNHDVQQTKGYITSLCKWCRIKRILIAFFRIR